ncbi:arylsulfatase [Flavivirga algicola]|uniref:Arylsulfatase n=1 Tax=Flavivirga algicola TaxID=2729136 RepID=A0ABX1RV13_9FLAO|nr:arylsulfatase [Flavivirga algicola]NMH86888.1 arylsulfatase [Flavivirga algicola]
MKRLLLILVLIFVSSNHIISQSISKKRKLPNIIYILADDMSYFDLSGLGQKHFDTPNLDSLMNQGMFFSQAYSGSSECAPSRASLLTGMHMGHCRIRRNESYRGQEYLEKDDITIAEMLKKAGYTTGMFGKWGIGLPGTPGTPDKQGFDYSFGYYDQTRAHGYFPNYLMENGNVVPLTQNYGFDMTNTYAHRFYNGQGEKGIHIYDKYGKLKPKRDNNKTLPNATYSQDLIQEKVLSFIQENKSKPFFLYYPTQLPHGPLIIPDISKFKDKNWSIQQKEWAAMVELLDKHVGQIVKYLEENNIRDNTLIMFSTDNGYSQHGYTGRAQYTDDKLFKHKGPWDRGKSTASDGGSRIQFFANWPDEIEPGTKSNEIIALYDIFATYCDIANIRPPKTDGKSFLPILKGKNRTIHKYLYWENGSSSREMQSTRIGDIFAYREGYDKPVKIYDLSKDIGCSINIAHFKPEMVKKALKIFKKEHVASKWYRNPEDSEEDILKKIKKAKDSEVILVSIKANKIKPQTRQELYESLKKLNKR